MMSMRRYRDCKEMPYLVLAILGSTAIRLFVLFIFVALCVSKVWLPTICWTAFFFTCTILSIITRPAGVRGNLPRIGRDQFPEIEQLVADLVQGMGLMRVPEVYLTPNSVPSGQVMMLSKCDVLILSTGLLDLVTRGEQELFRFLVARQLGRLALRHPARAKWVYGSGLIPFVGSAYARACVRSADAVGAALVPEAAVAGLCMISSGPNLLHRLNVQAYLEQAERTRNALSWLAEHLSGTPFLPSRIRRCM
jgi:Zn-dependent protease with chaperone function